jgi:hypothetical protein
LNNIKITNNQQFIYRYLIGDTEGAFEDFEKLFSNENLLNFIKKPFDSIFDKKLKEALVHSDTTVQLTALE